MKITFELSREDLTYFRRQMQQARQAVRSSDQEQIVDAVRNALAETRNLRLPEFVRKRMTSIESLIGMVSDSDWASPAPERRAILEALVYFADPEDMIPDHVPGLGFLDDAIIIELVCRKLRHEIEAYQDFCRWRERNTGSDDKPRIARERDRLRARCERRKKKDASR